MLKILGNMKKKTFVLFGHIIIIYCYKNQEKLGHQAKSSQHLDTLT